MRYLLLLALSGPGAALAGDSADVEKFAARLDVCAPATLSQPHPLVSGFVSTHTIHGTNAQGRCDYRQTMPGGMRTECAFSDGGRHAYAREFAALADGRPQDGDADAWQRECELVMPDGSRNAYLKD